MLNGQRISISLLSRQKVLFRAINKEVVLEIGRRLVSYSVIGNPDLWHPPYYPKGYHPGHFINNWQIGIDSPPVGEIAGYDASGEASYERLTHVGRWTVGHTFYIVNNVKYAAALENGHSSQIRPQGMVGRVMLEVPQIIHDAEVKVAREKLWAFEGD